MNKDKWLHTMKIYDHYEREMARARAEKELSFPIDEETRLDVINRTKNMLCYKEELVPTVHNVEIISSEKFEGYTVTQQRYETWEGFFGCATVFMPEKGEALPMVFLLCGHGDDGRRTRNYVKAAHRLAALGMAVCIPDNIGQGDRGDTEKKNHNFCHTPFYCGLTLQGMIVMETHAVIKHMISNPRIDKEKIGACGNSGGGTLSLFSAAIIPEIKVLASTGYPSEFSYILTKERRHCCCNLLPGVAKGPEMWEILSTFAPKPLLLEQGRFDDLIPIDLAQRNARKVQNIYIQKDAADKFRFAFTQEKHSWADSDILEVTGFLAKHLGVAAENDDMPSSEIVEKRNDWHVNILDRSITTSECAQIITGIMMPEGTELHDIFRPKYNGAEISADEIEEDLGRGSVMRILAQFECTLNGMNK